MFVTKRGALRHPLCPVANHLLTEIRPNENVNTSLKSDSLYPHQVPGWISIPAHSIFNLDV